jgi:hypothetical protein
VAPKPSPNPWVTVPFVAGHSLGSASWTPNVLRNPHGIHQRLKLRRLMLLPRRHFRRERQALAVSNQVQLGSKPAS